MPRFVVLEHDHPHRHWDFMLQWGPALRTWRLADEPRARLSTPCESLSDHRLAYLDYEGPVSGGRGVVSRVLAGDYRIVHDTAGALTVELLVEGRRLTITLSPPSGPGMATIR
jgi:hypothetical protein